MVATYLPRLTGVVTIVLCSLSFCVVPGIGSRAQTSTSVPTLPASPIANARTIQFTVKREYNRGDKSLVKETLNVQVARPNRVRIEAVFAATPDAKDIYVSDGTVQHDYTAARNQFETATEGSDSISSTARIVSKVDMLVLNLQQAPAEGVTRTFASDTLEGRAMVLRTETRVSPATKTQSASTLIDKLWVDATTGLPYKTARLTAQGDKTEELVHAYYMDWKFDQTIPAARFTWTAPAGAKEVVTPKLLTIGTTAPEFTLAGTNGKTIQLSDYRGKVVVLDFWATWCGPCQASMPHLESVYRKVKNEDVAVIAACVLDEKKPYEAWVKAKKRVYTFPTFFDTAGRGSQSLATGKYGVAGIPTQYVIDRDGKVAAALVGYDEGDHRLEDALIKLGVNLAARVQAKSEPKPAR